MHGGESRWERCITRDVVREAMSVRCGHSTTEYRAYLICQLFLLVVFLLLIPVSA